MTHSNRRRYLKLPAEDRTVLDEPADNASSPFRWTLWVTSYGRMIYEFRFAMERAGSRGALMFGIIVVFLR
jgi:hypothetical protein